MSLSNQTNTSYSGSEIDEWNLDGLTDRQLTILVHRMLMYETICKNVKNTNRNICKMIIAGFTGQLRGWWDNYMSLEKKVIVINATSSGKGVDNLGMALVANREDVVYTLVLTILQHFNGRFTNQSEIVRTLLNGLRCRTLGEFKWYKDTYMSRVMELPENNGLSPLFAHRVRKIPRNNLGEIPYKDYTYDSLRWISLDKYLSWEIFVPSLVYQILLLIERRRRRRNIEILETPILTKPYRKKKSRYISKEERDARKAFRKSNRFTKNRSKRELAKIKAPNYKLEKLETLELEEEVHERVYSFLCTSGSEFDYVSDLSSEEEIDFLDLSYSNQHGNTCNACHGDICSCENDEFYKLQSPFEDLNINTITSDNVIELLKEVSDNDLCEKIIHLAASNNTSSSFSKNIKKQKNDFEFEYSALYSLSEINNRPHKQTIHTRISSFDDLKNEIENLKI
ncbi:hypothetical protein H5410_040719 [Solanum commersonii]|uniref:DUF7746 domain-containing protein n=1 Tax=Solanum commersonii TaxID=4109 RepID=A0A9J5XQY4_SOLCO|nr:hypothetical protein H5410_040719 [Solanum commersonii]